RILTLTQLRPKVTVFHKEGVRYSGMPLVFANIILEKAWIDGNGLSEIYGQIDHLRRNEEPRAVLLEIGLRGALFGDDVRIAELLVLSPSEVKDRGIAVYVDEEVTKVVRVVVLGGLLEALQHLGLGMKDPI